MRELFLNLWEYIKTNPINFLLIIVGSVFVIWLLKKLIRNFYHYSQSKKLIYYRVTIPREDSPKDKEKQTEKDFREKVSIMSQFFRSLHETRELNLFNIIKTRIFKNNIFSFELVAHQKVVDFYVVFPKYYKGIVEKQITSYYPNAN
ncbi:hypothetical protein GF366_04705, partial [Candidatus Peregrinibacteria bacterium]|nr:hypothetical protein [Candidatus Peregrinibacteria bacterium]